MLPLHETRIVSEPEESNWHPRSGIGAGHGQTPTCKIIQRTIAFKGFHIRWTYTYIYNPHLHVSVFVYVFFYVYLYLYSYVYVYTCMFMFRHSGIFAEYRCTHISIADVCTKNLASSSPGFRVSHRTSPSNSITSKCSFCFQSLYAELISGIPWCSCAQCCTGMITWDLPPWLGLGTPLEVVNPSSLCSCYEWMSWSIERGVTFHGRSNT